MSNNKGYSKLKPGDIIWGKRYDTPLEMELLPEGSREGSFVVVKKHDDKILCLYGTARDTHNPKNRWSYYFNNKDGTQNEIYYTNFCLYELSSNNFIRKIANLSDSDFEALTNYLKSIKTEYPVRHLNNKRIGTDFFIDTGDIVSSKLNYFVLSRENNIINCLPIKSSKKKLNDSFTPAHLEKIDYANVTTLDLEKDDVEFITTLNTNYTKYILSTYSEYLQRLQKAQRGAVVLARGQLHYIYGEEGKVFTSFRMQKKFNDTLIEVIINRKKYYIDFNQIIELDKKEEIEVKYLASTSEIEEIKNQRKQYSKLIDDGSSKKVSNLKICKENLRPGTTFKTRDNDIDIFVVMKVVGKIVTYVNENYLDMQMNIQNNTDMKSIDCIVDNTKEKLSENREKIKRLTEKCY